MIRVPPRSGPSSTATPVADSAKPAQAPGSVDEVTVRPGDNLWNLSRSRYGAGAAWKLIKAANPGLVKGETIQPGTTLKLPPAVPIARLEKATREAERAWKAQPQDQAREAAFYAADENLSLAKAVDAKAHDVKHAAIGNRDNVLSGAELATFDADNRTRAEPIENLDEALARLTDETKHR